jgi:hypothetical protein
MENASFKFTMPLKVDVIEEKGEQKVFLEGFLSTDAMDLVNDIVTKNCMESMQKQLIDRNIKLDIEHEAFRGKSFEEKEINKTKIPAGRFIDAAVESIGRNRWGLRTKSVLNRFNPRYGEIKGNVMDRMLDAYSIAFIATKVRHEKIDGKDVRFLDDVTLLNAALTGNPINTEALNREIFMKSIQSLEDYETEKKSNPDTEKLLEVKCSNPIGGDAIKAGGLKNMQTPTDTQEAKAEGVHGGTYGKEGGNAPGKEAADETTSSVSAKAPKDETTSTESTEMKNDLLALKSRVDALEMENKQLKSMSVPKSPGANAGTMKQAEFEQKSQKKSGGPLDYI